ncbi:MAG TPA: cyclase family protein [Isosphaeraceae bacterium]|nr:cyclase family protein [Isosphaeraceae bacterium]
MRGQAAAKRWAGLAVAMCVGVAIGGFLIPAGPTPLRGSEPNEAPPAIAPAESSPIKGWQKGKGWGWVWGPEDQVGSLNAMTDASRAAALTLAKKGEVFDLGMTYSRNSYKWAGHSPGEIISFRSPDGIARMKDKDATPDSMNADKVLWHSEALFINDNVATQIDGLAHITAGPDFHWYNGFKEADWGGDWGPRKCDVTTIPPIVARGVLIDVAGYKKLDALPGHTVISTQDLKDTLAWENVSLQPGDVVLIRTGTGRYWAEDGADHATIADHDSAGPDLVAIRWLVEDQGAMMIGSDTSGLEVSPPPGHPGSTIPCHRYLLVDQGVHIGEFHYLEDLSKAKAYAFCYVAMTNKIKGTVAGFALRPIAIR